MRRLLRWAFNLSAVVSAVLFVGLCVLWVRSYRTEDRLYARRHLRYLSLASFRGEVGCEFGAVYGGGPPDLYTPWQVIGVGRVPVDLVPQSDYIHIAEAEGRFGRLPHYHDVCGFRWHPRSDRNWEYRERGVAVPAWFLATAAGLLPALRAAGSVRSRVRRGKGLCASCGYDLRATPEGGGALLERCPECGAEGAEGAAPGRA